MGHIDFGTHINNTPADRPTGRQRKRERERIPWPRKWNWIGSILKCILKLQQIYLGLPENKWSDWVFCTRFKLFCWKLCVCWSKLKSVTNVLHVFLSSSESDSNAADDKQPSHNKERCFFYFNKPIAISGCQFACMRKNVYCRTCFFFRSFIRIKWLGADILIDYFSFIFVLFFLS